MLTRLSQAQAATLFLAALISWPGSAIAAGAQRERAPAGRPSVAAATSQAAVPQNPWPLIHIPDPVVRRVTVTALEKASARLADGECRKILTDFEDADGRSLADRLSAVAVDIHAYLKMITFIDDTRHRRCAGGALALTIPGGRVVRVCTDEVKQIQALQPDYVLASLIHEILHTLGLGETPPSSAEITRRVLSRCGRK